MYYTVYKTTNLITGKIYIGIHETENINDEYLGSGFTLKKSIRKYGREHFKKDILFVFDNKKEMIDKEIELVNDEFVKNTNTYNITMGGFGLSTLSPEKKIQALEKMRLSQLNRDYTNISPKRLKTMLDADPDVFKKIGIRSGIKQHENYKNGYVNPHKKFEKVKIFNSQNVVAFECLISEIKTLCLKNKLPERSLIKSLRLKGTPLFYEKSPKNPEYIKFKNWYALYESDVRLDINQYFEIVKLNKEKFANDRSKDTPFHNKICRGKAPSRNFEIYNDKNELVYTINSNIKAELKNKNLPVNSFLYSYRNNKKLLTGKFKDWYAKKL